MTRLDIVAGCSIDRVAEVMVAVASVCGECACRFNDVELVAHYNTTPGELIHDFRKAYEESR